MYSGDLQSTPYSNRTNNNGLLRSLSIFFFQAEDGIRYLTVTGVQTCALPIYVAARLRSIAPPDHLVISQSTQQHIAPFYSTERLESFVLRGRAEPVVAHRVIAPEIGRAACRGRGEISVVAGSLKKKKRENRSS